MEKEHRPRPGSLESDSVAHCGAQPGRGSGCAPPCGPGVGTPAAGRIRLYCGTLGNGSSKLSRATGPLNVPHHYITNIVRIVMVNSHLLKNALVS